MRKQKPSRPRIIIDLDEVTFQRLGDLIPRGVRNEVFKQITADLIAFIENDRQKAQLYLGAVMQRALRLRDYHQPAKDVEDGIATKTPAELDRAGLAATGKLSAIDQGVATREQKAREEQELRDRDRNKEKKTNPTYGRGPLRQLD